MGALDIQGDFGLEAIALDDRAYGDGPDPPGPHRDGMGIVAVVRFWDKLQIG